MHYAMSESSDLGPQHRMVDCCVVRFLGPHPRAGVHPYSSLLDHMAFTFRIARSYILSSTQDSCPHEAGP